MNRSPTDSEGSDSISFFSLSDKKIDQKKEKKNTHTGSRSVGFEPTTSGFGDLRSTKLN